MKNPQQKILGRPLNIAIGVLIIGAMFKIMHWSYANEIMVTTFAIIGGLYILRFWNKRSKLITDYLKLIVVISWSIQGVLTILHLPYRNIFAVLAWIALIAWFPLEGFNYFKNRGAKMPYNTNPSASQKGSQKDFLLFGLLAIAVVFTLSGVAFKAMDSPYPIPDMFLMSGMGLGVIYVLIRALTKDN